jgi:hypothetical protein
MNSRCGGVKQLALVGGAHPRAKMAAERLDRQKDGMESQGSSRLSSVRWMVLAAAVFSTANDKRPAPGQGRAAFMDRAGLAV